MTAKALQYHILYEEYVERMTTRHIMLKHSISESTFHRYRHAALAILAEELVGPEASSAARLRTRDPVPLDYLG